MTEGPDHDSSAQTPAQEPPGRRSMSWITHVVLACVVGVAAAGMVMGFYGTVNPSRQPAPIQTRADSAQTDLKVTTAVAYIKMKDANRSPNAQWKTAWPTTGTDPTEFYGEAPADREARAVVNAQRAQRRAFDGAPPVVPHAIDQQNTASCLVCHGKGLKVGAVVAPRMSHEVYANCTQCHVESTNRALPPTGEARAPANEFVGLAAPGPGERAWPGAPPVIPHTTWMRENCASCHGSLAQKGLRTSHPWRGNCMQCHGASAELNQWRLADSERPPVPKLPGANP